jgi:hypothetical protein
MTIVPLPSHGLSTAIPELHHASIAAAPSVLEPDLSRSFRPTPHRRSHHPIEPPSPPPRRFPGLPSAISVAAGDGSRGCSSRVGGEAQDQKGNGEEGHAVPVRALGWRERRGMSSGMSSAMATVAAVWAGDGGLWQPWRLFRAVLSHRPSLHPVSGPSRADHRYHLPLERERCQRTSRRQPWWWFLRAEGASRRDEGTVVPKRRRSTGQIRREAARARGDNRGRRGG